MTQSRFLSKSWTKERLREQTQLNQTRLMTEIEASQKTMKEHAQANEELCEANEELRALSWTTSHPGTFPKLVIKRLPKVVFSANHGGTYTDPIISRPKLPFFLVWKTLRII